MTQQLSHAAQAVRSAAGWQGTSLEREAQNIAAAVLRSAADQVVIKLGGLGQESAWYLEEIAAELEAQ